MNESQVELDEQQERRTLKINEKKKIIQGGEKIILKLDKFYLIIKITVLH